MKSKLAIAVTLSGWVIFITYIFSGYKEYGSSILKHLFALDDLSTTILHHIFMLTIPIGSTITGYLINERKKLLEKTQLSEKKYRDLVGNTLAGVYKTNFKGSILYANEALAKMFEFESPEEMMQGGALSRYKNPEDREVLIEKLKKTGKVSNFKFEALTKTGKPKSVLLSATLEGDTISGVVIDVTESRRLENALVQRVKELEEFYDMAVGRELKMVELKEEIKRLKEELRKYNA